MCCIPFVVASAVVYRLGATAGAPSRPFPSLARWPHRGAQCHMHRRAHARLRFAADDAQAPAPLLGVEPSRLVLRDESLEHRDEAPGRLELRQGGGPPPTPPAGGREGPPSP